MKIEELTREQIEKARSLATNEERLDYLKACGVELDDDMLAEVAGGGVWSDSDHLLIYRCLSGSNKGKPHKWVQTGKTKKIWGLWKKKENKCIYCGVCEWR